jgi:serine/threonine-protein kinase HipA
MNPSLCLYCRKPLRHPAQGDFHPGCSRNFFGSSHPPVLPYTLGNLHELARQIVQRSIAVPGVQPKLSLAFEKSVKGTPSRLTLVGVLGHFILKPPHPDYPTLVENEYLTMQLARWFGLLTVPFSFIRLASGELAYITRRIDRLADGLKLPMEDFCQLTERLTEYKYRASMEQVGKALRRFSSSPGLDAVRLFEYTIFSFLTGNADMHLKNFSLLTSPNGETNLAPAYDLVATRLVVPEDPEEMALTINGKKSRLKQADFRSFAASLGLPEKTVGNVFAHFYKQMAGARTLIEQFEPQLPEQQNYLNLIGERAERLELE